MQLPTIQSIRDYITGQAPNYGVPVPTALGIFQAEGNVTSSTVPYGHPDPSRADPSAYSYGPFQFNSSPGAVGPEFQAATGLDYTDPKNASQMIDYSLAKMGDTGVGPWTDTFTRGRVADLNAGMDNFGSNPGTAANPLPGLTAEDYGSPVGPQDFSAGTGSIGSTAGQFNPGLAGSGLNSGNAITGSNLNQYGFGTSDVSAYTGNPPIDVASANAGTGQYSGGGFAPIGDTGFARVTDAGGSNALATTNTSPSTYGGGGSAPVTAGPGMPVADQGLATAASNAGTSISQAISGPESSSIKQAGQDVTQAGQTVSQGVNQAANTVSSTGIGIFKGIEKYVGEFFLYAAVLVVGVIFLAIGLSKFGGPKVYTARA